jgi:hypothetical protein
MMGKFKKAKKMWQRLPRETQQRIKRKARKIVGRNGDSKK